MDRKSIRIGNLVCDSSNDNYIVRAGITEISLAHRFSPLALRKKDLRNFETDTINGNEVFYFYEGEKLCSLEVEGEEWRVSIHSKNLKIEGTIQYVHELQNLLYDSGFTREIWSK